MNATRRWRRHDNFEFDFFSFFLLVCECSLASSFAWEMFHVCGSRAVCIFIWILPTNNCLSMRPKHQTHPYICVRVSCIRRHRHHHRRITIILYCCGVLKSVCDAHSPLTTLQNFSFWKHSNRLNVLLIVLIEWYETLAIWNFECSHSSQLATWTRSSPINNTNLFIFRFEKVHSLPGTSTHLFTWPQGCDD